MSRFIIHHLKFIIAAFCIVGMNKLSYMNYITYNVFLHVRLRCKRSFYVAKGTGMAEVDIIGHKKRELFSLKITGRSIPMKKLVQLLLVLVLLLNSFVLDNAITIIKVHARGSAN